MVVKNLNKALSAVLDPYKEKNVCLLFSGGIDSVWLYATLKNICQNLTLVHFYPSDISNDCNVDYRNTIYFHENLSSVKFIPVKILDEELHKLNKLYNNFQPFRVYESHCILHNLLSEFDVIIRGEDTRIHTPFIRYSDFLAYNRKYGFPYWKNTNKFTGEHIIASLWNRYLGVNREEYVDKYGVDLNIRNSGYKDLHLKACRNVVEFQSKEDEYIGSFYGQRNVVYPFSNDFFLSEALNNIDDLIKKVTRPCIDEFKHQKIVIQEALLELGIPPKVAHKKATLGVQVEMLNFLDLDYTSSYEEMSIAWENYLKQI